MDQIDLSRLIALVAFAGTYLGLALGRLPLFRVDRTGVAIIGGAVVMVSGVVSWTSFTEVTTLTREQSAAGLGVKVSTTPCRRLSTAGFRMTRGRTVAI